MKVRLELLGIRNSDMGLRIAEFGIWCAVQFPISNFKFPLHFLNPFGIYYNKKIVC